MSHQQQGHMEMGSRFKVSSERPEKRGIDGHDDTCIVKFRNDRSDYCRWDEKKNKEKMLQN